MACEWYFLRVQVGREDRIRKNMVARLKQAGHEEKVPQVIVPTETVADHRAGKRRIRKKKLYPGYLMVEMELTDDVWFILRETPGFGDFVDNAAGLVQVPQFDHQLIAHLVADDDSLPLFEALGLLLGPGNFR